jgi:hypothetical protein
MHEVSSDLTVLYITANEMPVGWTQFQLWHLHKAADGFPRIAISRAPMPNWPGPNLLDTEPKSFWNLYMQLLRGAMSAETPYVAMAEDDALYSREHFTRFRPPLDRVAYNHSRWSLFTWDPIYCLRQRLSNCSLIAPRDLLIEALQERKAKWPHGAPDEICGEVGRERVDRRLGVTARGCVEWWSTVPIIHLNHPSGTDPTQRTEWKAHGELKAIEIPYWGKAKEIARVYESARVHMQEVQVAGAHR